MEGTSSRRVTLLRCARLVCRFCAHCADICVWDYAFLHIEVLFVLTSCYVSSCRICSRCQASRCQVSRYVKRRIFATSSIALSCTAMSSTTRRPASAMQLPTAQASLLHYCSIVKAPIAQAMLCTSLVLPADFGLRCASSLQRIEWYYCLFTDSCTRGRMLRG